MTRKTRTNVSAAGRILDHVLIDGKKTVVALGLVGVMAIMWVRVLTGHKPGAAAAADELAPPPATAPEAPPRVRFIELPKQPGRHDAVAKDFFTVQDRAGFRLNGETRNPGTDAEVRVSSSDHAQEVIHRVAQKLKLDAVLWGENQAPRAFLNDQLFRVGDKLTVREGTDVVEFEVLRIYENSVLVRSGGIEQLLEVKK